MKLLIGCDPELALMNPNTGKYVSAEGLLPGDKLNPHKVKKGTVQVDGFAAEIGIDPASSADEFCDNVQTVLMELKKFVPGYEFKFIDSVIFEDDVYLHQSDKGRELGCEPDFSAHTKVANPQPVPNPKQLRTFSGHIHIGWCEDSDITDPGHFADCISVAKQMDWALGIPTMIWNPKSTRRQLYGKAGCFRPKSYGAEYRTPDNGWLISEERMRLVFNNAILGMNRLYEGKHYTQQFAASGLIDQGYDAAGCIKYLQALKIPYIVPEKAQKKKVAESTEGTVTARMIA